MVGSGGWVIGGWVGEFGVMMIFSDCCWMKLLLVMLMMIW